MDNKLVTVIIPTYNRGHLIERSIVSVLNQTYRDFELIVVDDGSTDNTKEVVKSILDERIKYMRSPVNRGPANARNIGIRGAKGEYIAFQDSDDEWLPDKLEKQVKRFQEASPNTGMVYGRIAFWEGEVIVGEIPSKETPTEDKEGYIFKRLLMGNLIGTPVMLIKKSVLEDVGLFETNLKALEDYEMALRIAKKYEIAFVDQVVIKANKTENSVNSGDISGYLLTTSFLLKKYEEDYKKYGLWEAKLSELDILGPDIKQEVLRIIGN